MSGTIILLVIITLIGLLAVSMYNQLVAMRNRYKNSFAQIDVQLKRRHDLIPNLVETAKTYLKHEKETLEGVIAARNSASQLEAQAAKNPGDPGKMRQLSQAEGVLSGALGKFMALAESYPDLKANQTMSQLMEELSSTENKVGFARQAYNDAVMMYNTAREKFPQVIFAGAFGFGPAELFEISNQAEREAPKVQF